MPRFMRKGTTKIWFVPTIADTSAATAVEVNAGTPLSDQLAEINGFNYSNNPIDTPDMGAAFVGKIPGEDTVDNSDMSFYELSDGNPIKTALAKGTVGHVVIASAGIADADHTAAAADVVDIWPCIIASASKIYDAGNTAASYRVVYTLTDPPVEDLALA